MIRRQSEVSDVLLSEKRSWERDKNHSKSPIGLTHSLPAISQNQFISTKHMHDYQRNSKKAMEDSVANKDLNMLEEVIALYLTHLFIVVKIVF